MWAEAWFDSVGVQGLRASVQRAPGLESGPSAGTTCGLRSSHSGGKGSERWLRVPGAMWLVTRGQFSNRRQGGREGQASLPLEVFSQNGALLWDQSLEEAEPGPRPVPWPPGPACCPGPLKTRPACQAPLWPLGWAQGRDQRGPSVIRGNDGFCSTWSEKSHNPLLKRPLPEQVLL